MKLHYYPETDSLYIELKDIAGTQTREIVEGLIVDLDENGDVVGLDIDHASGKLDLSKIETFALPPATAADMNEAETRAELIDPALKAAGWGVVADSRVRREIDLPRAASKARAGAASRRSPTTCSPSAITSSR